MKVLLIEERPGPTECASGAGVLAAVERQLKEKAHEVRREYDRERALASFLNDPSDLVVIDLGDDLSEGLDWCQRLRKAPNGAWCVLIVVAPTFQLSDVNEAIRTGADDYLRWTAREEVIALRLALAERRAEDRAARRRMEQELRLAKQSAERAYNRIQRDLRTAARVQHSLLPTHVPYIPGVRLAWRYLPSAELGGDGLNVFQVGPSQLGVYLLDVSGHGVTAALLSVSLAHELPPQHPEHAGSPAEVAARLNRWLMADRANEQFFTMIYGVLDVHTLVFRYVSAGHPDLLHVSASGQTRFERGLAEPIGVNAKAVFREQYLQLHHGDTLLLYSDGIIESMDAGRRLFGPDRLAHCAASLSEGLEVFVDDVLEAAQAWSGGSPHDDISLLGLSLEELTWEDE
jgi:sigma-B regulation protein RsbU (phosphoserine phosphatase)